MNGCGDGPRRQRGALAAYVEFSGRDGRGVSVGCGKLQRMRFASPALPTARLFVRRDGRTLRAHHVHAAWSTARRSADLPGVHLHDLRHAGLTLAAQSGATLAEVMRRAGHSSSRAAMIPQPAAGGRAAEVGARLGRLAAGTTSNRTGT